MSRVATRERLLKKAQLTWMGHQLDRWNPTTADESKKGSENQDFSECMCTCACTIRIISYVMLWWSIEDKLPYIHMQCNKALDQAQYNANKWSNKCMHVCVVIHVINTYIYVVCSLMCDTMYIRRNNRRSVHIAIGCSFIYCVYTSYVHVICLCNACNYNKYDRATLLCLVIFFTIINSFDRLMMHAMISKY